jgi:uncharacterized protein YrzB (UPF0473 family)
MLDKKTMIITDDSGVEQEMEILFTFQHEVSNKQYVIFSNKDVPEDSEEKEIYVCSYDDDGNLENIEDEKELEMIQEVVSAFQIEDDDELEDDEEDDEEEK